MNGINISQARAEDLSLQGFDIYLDPETGFWIRTDNVPRHVYTYTIYRTADVEEQIPSGAFDWQAAQVDEAREAYLNDVAADLGQSRQHGEDAAFVLGPD